MGGHRVFNEQGGFSQYLYHRIGEVVNINGMQVSTIAKIDEDTNHGGMPFYSKTSDVYLKIDPIDGKVEQAVIFANRKAILEIDWGHEHHGKNGNPSFKKGEVHVHTIEEENGVVRRTKEPARWMNTEEMRKYGDIIRYANPDAKMR